VTLGQGGVVPAPSDTSGQQGSTGTSNPIGSLQQLLGATPAQAGGTSTWAPQIGSPLGETSQGVGLGYGGDLYGIPYQVWNSVSTILGYDARQAFLSYVQASDPAGIDLSLTSAPPSTSSRGPVTIGPGGVGSAQSQTKIQENEAETFLNTMLNAAMANPQNWVIRRAQEYWSSTYGGEMPQSVVSQIQQAIAQGGPGMARMLAGATLTTTVSGQLPSFVKTLVDDAAAMDPSTKGQMVSQEQAALASSRMKQYIDTFGVAPGLDQQQVVAMDQQGWTDYMNNQMYRSGMTLGQYTDARTLLDNAGWVHWFGSQPGDTDVKWAMGKSPEDITARIDQSPYQKIPGMNIGTYKGFSTEGDSISKAVYGSSLPDHLIQAMWNAGIRPAGATAPQ
jgi:hypothetical protein